MFKRRFMPFFDADGGSGAGGSQEPPADSSKDDSKEPSKMSFDDFLKDKDNQAEFNRRMQKGIKTALDNEKSRLEALADERVSEAEKLNKMTELEKKEYLQQKKEKEMEDREKAITRRELMAEARNTLAEKKLPSSLAEILDYADADKCKSSLSTVEKAFREAVEAGVEERLKGGKPPKEATNGSDKEDLEKQIYDLMKG